MLRFKNVTFKYLSDENNLIENLSFNVSKGDFISIIGASGCGKSTLFRLINSLDFPQNGDILIKNTNIKNLKNYASYMPQKDLLLPWKSILDNISLPLKFKKLDKNTINKKCDYMLEECGLLEYKHKFPRDLSGGMKQRISFIRTLLNDTDILLLDEPFSALDALTKISMQEWLLNQYMKFKKTILFITHDVEEAIFLSNKIFIITDNPISKLEEINIDIPYPRDRECLKNKDILDLKENLIKKLKTRILL